jgi:hypothetical protein
MRTSTNSISRIFVATLITLAAASCAQVDADIPETKVTQKSVAFQGIPGAQSAGEVSIVQSFTLGTDDLSWAKDVNSDVTLDEVELTAVSGVNNLGFIRTARITMSAGDGTATPPVEVVNYERPANYQPSPVLDVPTLYPVNVTEVWASNKVVLTLYLTGIFPEQNWAADVTLHMSGKISYKF